MVHAPFGVADERVDELVLEEFLYSFEDLRDREVPVFRPDGLIHGILRDGVDIPDLCAAFMPGKITLRKPLDGLLRPVPVSRIRKKMGTRATRAST